MPKERSTKRQRVSTSSESATQAFLGRNIDLLARPFSLPAELDAATQEVAEKALKLLKGKREGKVKPLFHEARREAVERQLRVFLCALALLPRITCSAPHR